MRRTYATARATDLCASGHWRICRDFDYAMRPLLEMRKWLCCCFLCGLAIRLCLWTVKWEEETWRKITGSEKMPSPRKTFNCNCSCLFIQMKEVKVKIEGILISKKCFLLVKFIQNMFLILYNMSHLSPFKFICRAHKDSMARIKSVEFHAVIKAPNRVIWITIKFRYKYNLYAVIFLYT